MISVVKDSTDLLIKIWGARVLKIKRVDRAHVAFYPNQHFWDVWHTEKKHDMKNSGLSVGKDDNNDYEVYMSLEWFNYHLTPKGREKFESYKEKKKN